MVYNEEKSDRVLRDVVSTSDTKFDSDIRRTNSFRQHLTVQGSDSGRVFIDVTTAFKRTTSSLSLLFTLN